MNDKQKRLIHFANTAYVETLSYCVNHNNECLCPSLLWYSSSELVAMREAARGQSRYLRELNSIQILPDLPSNTNSSLSVSTSPLIRLDALERPWFTYHGHRQTQNDSEHSDKLELKSHRRHKLPKEPTLALDSNSRGLEQRLCLERQRRTALARRFILKASYKLLKGEDFATLDRSMRDERFEKLARFSRKCTEWASVLAIEEGMRDYVRAYSNDDSITFHDEKITTKGMPAILRKTSSNAAPSFVVCDSQQIRARSA